MSREHIHYFRKVVGKLYCMYPTCLRKYTAEEIHGHLIRCSQCKDTFLYDRANYLPTDYQITCHKCNPKVPFHLTLEAQKAILGDILLNDLETALKSRREELNRKESALEKRSDELLTLKDKLWEKEQDYRIASQKLKRQRDHITQMFKTRRSKSHKAMEPKVAPGEGNSPGDIVVNLIDQMFKEGKLN